MAEKTYVLSPEAQAEFDEILGYIAINSGRIRARRVAERIMETFSLLARYPRIGRVQRDLDGEPLQYSIPPWIVLYEPEADKGIQILRFFDSRRDRANVLRGYDRRGGRAKS